MISCGVIGSPLFLFTKKLQTIGLYGMGIMTIGVVLGLALHNYSQFNEIRSDT